MYPSYIRHEQKGNSLYCLYSSSVNLKSLQNNKALHILDNYSGDILILAQLKKNNLSEVKIKWWSRMWSLPSSTNTSKIHLHWDSSHRKPPKADVRSLIKPKPQESSPHNQVEWKQQNWEGTYEEVVKEDRASCPGNPLHWLGSLPRQTGCWKGLEFVWEEGMDAGLLAIRAERDWHWWLPCQHTCQPRTHAC